MTHIWLTYWHMMFIFMTHDIHDITKSRPQRRSRSRQAPSPQSPQSPQSPAEQPWTENRWGKASKHETETYWNCRKPCLFAMSFWSLSFVSFRFCLGWNLNQVSAVRLKPLHRPHPARYIELQEMAVNPVVEEVQDRLSHVPMCSNVFQ